MTIIFLLGISAMGRTQAADGMGALADCMSGIVILLLVLLCPYAVFKFVHWASEGADAETIHRAGGTGAMMARQHTERAARKAAAAMSGGAAGGGAAAGAGSPQGPSQIPGQGPDGIAQINPTGGSGGQGQESGPSSSPAAAGLAKAVQPHPTSPSNDTSRQPGGALAPPDGDWARAPGAVSGSGPSVADSHAAPPPPSPTGT